MTQAGDTMSKYKNVKLQKATKRRSMLGGSAATVEVHPELKRTTRGAPTASIHEDAAHEAVVVFGRLNPPTVGHERLLEGVAAVSASHEAGEVLSYPLLFLSKTINESNPLPYKRRVELARQAFPDIHVIEENEVKDYLSLFKYVSEAFDYITIFVGSDRFADVNRILETYNGTEFTFESYSIQVMERDPDSDKIQESISATQLRVLAESANLEDFTNALPTALRGEASDLMEELRGCIAQQRYLKEETGLRKVAKATLINRKR